MDIWDSKSKEKTIKINQIFEFNDLKNIERKIKVVGRSETYSNVFRGIDLKNAEVVKIVTANNGIHIKNDTTGQLIKTLDW